MTPVEPPRDGWPEIQAALGLRRPAPATNAWRALAAGFALVAIVFGSLYFAQPNVDQARYVAVVMDTAAGPVWLLQAFAEAR